MTKKMKHLELDGCIINIRQGLYDTRGRRVTSIEIIPDDRYAGERIWKVYPPVHNIRVIQLKKRK